MIEMFYTCVIIAIKNIGKKRLNYYEKYIFYTNRSISNYLHNKTLISELLGLDENEEDYQELFILIDKWLKRAKLEGPYKGVEVINTRYGYSQSGGKGKYKGTRKR